MADYRRYTFKYLLKAFQEAGYPVSDRWIRRQIEKGNLILPRSVTHFRKFNLKSENRPKGAVYEMSMDQILKTVKAFTPGGKGYYNYLDDIK